MTAKLENQVAIITGGGTGVGRGIAECFLAEGAQLVLAQRRQEVAAKTGRALDPTGERVAVMKVDISCRTDVQRLIDFTLERYERIDVLVNNASITGIPAIRAFLEMEEEFIHQVVDVNLKGTIFCSQAAALAMRAQKGGAIIHISTVGAFAAQEGAAVYCSTKAGITGLTQAMALELIPYGIRVNAIAPGDVQVENNPDILGDLRARGVSGDYFRKIPIGRRGLPHEIGKTAVFLASDDASYVVGETIIVDGGFLIY